MNREGNVKNHKLSKYAKPFRKIAPDSLEET